MSISLAIVEDLKEVREGLCQYFSLQKEITVVAAYENAEKAVCFLPSLHPDVVIMDISLPGMNGIDCIQEIRKTSPATQFMMFTVYENDEKVFEALKQGASGYLLKNTGLPEILNAVVELHHGGSPMSSNIARKLVTAFQAKENKNAGSPLLTQRQNEILQLLSQGLLYKEISDKIGVTTGTVRQHIHNIYEILHVQNRTEAINKLAGRKF
jgi:DNA-binding NarL/FixJ family response regulator